MILGRFRNWEERGPGRSAPQAEKKRLRRKNIQKSMNFGSNPVRLGYIAVFFFYGYKSGSQTVDPDTNPGTLDLFLSDGTKIVFLGYLEPQLSFKKLLTKNIFSKFPKTFFENSISKKKWRFFLVTTAFWNLVTKPTGTHMSTGRLTLVTDFCRTGPVSML